MNFMDSLIACAAILTAGVSFAGAGEEGAPLKVLDTSSEQVEKLEVHDSMIGYRDTLIFYTFKDQKAVLRVGLDNTNKKFPVSATVYLFADAVTEAELKAWLNNQHSDGLFPDVPVPVATHRLPAEACVTKSDAFIDHAKHGPGEYDNYAVTFQINEVVEKGVFRLVGFTGETKVHVPTQ